MSDDRRSMLKTLGREPAPLRPVSALKPAEGDEEECLAFGYLRGTRDQSLHLQFRFQTGDTQSFPYSWLGPVRFDPSRGLALTFVGDKTWTVTIHGRNLAAMQAENVDLLNRGILRHRIVWVREMDPNECRRLPDEALTVERITIEVEKMEAGL
jgi:hypothetical protein